MIDLTMQTITCAPQLEHFAVDLIKKPVAKNQF
jgi:hypothetical protein